MARTARQQVEAWQRETRGVPWSGYDDDREALEDPDDDTFRRRVIRSTHHSHHRG